MNNDKYINYYIETLTNTLTDTLLRNISLQVSARIGEESSTELNKMLEEIKGVSQLEKERVELLLKQSQDENERLKSELNRIDNMRGEYESTKHQVNHLDTFRNELNKERDAHEQTHKHYNSIIQELKDKIDYLQLTPAKRKKIDEANRSVASQILPLTDENVKDGGSF
jgi:chromosome segregation ATPase